VSDKVEIQVQFAGGQWRTLSVVLNDPTYVLRGIKSASTQFPVKRVRAVYQGRLIDML
jgi:hypothetical protein